MVDGVLTEAHAVVYPTGESQLYSDRALPALSSETVQVQSAELSNVTGATLTSHAWMQSLASALAKAGLT